MRKVKNLIESDLKYLEDQYENSLSKDERRRAHGILLSNNNYKVKEIASIYNVKIRTVYSWLNRWEKGGKEAIKHQKGQGRHLKLTEIHQAEITQWVKEFPRSLKQVQQKITENFNFSVDAKTLRVYLKKNPIQLEKNQKNTSK